MILESVLKLKMPAFWIQTVRQSDSVPERFFCEKVTEKKQADANKSMKNQPARKSLMVNSLLFNTRHEKINERACLSSEAPRPAWASALSDQYLLLTKKKHWFLILKSARKINQKNDVC